MPMPWTRALRRTPLIAAIVAGSLISGGVTAARLSDDPPSLRQKTARVAAPAHADAPPARALGLTAAYFRALGIAAREAPAEPPVEAPPVKECETTASSRLARRASPAATDAPADSSHLTTARAPRETIPTEPRVPLTLSLRSE